jgi:hypothetical protein
MRLTREGFKQKNGKEKPSRAWLYYRTIVLLSQEGEEIYYEVMKTKSGIEDPQRGCCCGLRFLGRWECTIIGCEIQSRDEGE